MEIPKLGCYNLDKNHWSFGMPSICALLNSSLSGKTVGVGLDGVWQLAVVSKTYFWNFLDTCQDPSQARIFCANYLVELVEIVATLGEGYLFGSGWWFGTFFIFAYN